MSRNQQMFNQSQKYKEAENQIYTCLWQLVIFKQHTAAHNRCNDRYAAPIFLSYIVISDARRAHRAKALNSLLLFLLAHLFCVWHNNARNEKTDYAIASSAVTAAFLISDKNIFSLVRE